MQVSQYKHYLTFDKNTEALWKKFRAAFPGLTIKDVFLAGMSSFQAVRGTSFLRSKEKKNK